MAVAIAIGLVWFGGEMPVPENRNSLVLGEAAEEGTFGVALAKPLELTGYSTEVILAMRADMLADQPVRLAAPYHPWEGVFAGLRDGRGWMSVDALFMTGPGPHALQGPSAESRSLLNPLLLIGAEFWGLSIWDQGNLTWDGERLQEAEREVPRYPALTNLEYTPRARVARATWGVSAFLEQVQPFLAAPLGGEKTDFGIVAYNARDLGFSWIAFKPEESEQIVNPRQPAAPIPITDYLSDRGELCGAGQGCNHAHLTLGQFDSFRAAALPAKAVFWLWRNEPVGDQQGNPDLRFEIIVE